MRRVLVAVLALLAPIGASDAAVRPRYGGAAVRGILTPIRTLDPLRAASPAEREAALQVHAGLYRFDGGGEPVPDLVERAEVRPDGLAVHLSLRAASFHDGRPAGAEEARRAVERFAAETGAGALLAGRAGGPPLVVVTGPRELDLSVEAAPMLWRHLLADPRAAVLPAGGDGTVGLGPFRVGSLGPDGRTLVLLAADPAGRGRPLLDRIEYRVFADEAALALAHRHRGVDVVDLPPALVEAAERPAGESRELVALVLDLERPPIGDPALRRAVVAALRLDALVEVVLAGKAERAVSLLRPAPGAGPGRTTAVAAPPAHGVPLRIAYGEESLRPVAERLRVDLDAGGIPAAAPERGGVGAHLRLVVLPGGDGDPVVELAEAARVLGVAVPEPLRLAASGDPRSPRIADLVAAEAELRGADVVVPLFRRTRLRLVRPSLRDLGIGPAGLARFEDAWRWPPAPRP